MIKKLIKRDASYKIDRTTLTIGGTNIRQLGDMLTDALLLIPKRTIFGNVAWSFYQQAIEIYDQIGHKLMKMPYIKLRGHSLGGSVGLLLGLILTINGYKGKIDIEMMGSPKVLSKKARLELAFAFNNVSCRVRQRDIIPVLGWWKEPFHKTEWEGSPKKHKLDYDIKEHLMY